jgi:hypothetical protein
MRVKLEDPSGRWGLQVMKPCAILRRPYGTEYSEDHHLERTPGAGRQLSVGHLLWLPPDLTLLREVVALPDVVTATFDSRFEQAVRRQGQPQRFGLAVLVNVVERLGLNRRGCETSVYVAEGAALRNRLGFDQTCWRANLS